MTKAVTAPKLIAGNWKMNGLRADTEVRAKALKEAMQPLPADQVEMVLCPPATMIQAVGWFLQGSMVKWGGQDCHAESAGAFTGNISAVMLKDLGCSYVVLGHSERRQLHKETSEMVNAKVRAAHSAGLVAIVCVGETDDERSAGHANGVVEEQLAKSLPETVTAQNTVIAYEPVWAIGTGKTASAEDVRAMHAHIRIKVAAGMRILYGGSVKGSNAAEILHTDNVDGVLVGGASLKVDEFMEIAKAALRADGS